MLEVSKTQPIQPSVIIPAYGEGPHIFANIVKFYETPRDYRYEAIVVDDGIADNTCSESRRAADEGYPVRVVRQKTNRGKGASLFHGFASASGELVTFLDAHLEIAPENILQLWKFVQETGADVVAGVKDPSENKFPFLRRLLSGLYRRCVPFIFGLRISDTQTGVKLFKREVPEPAIPRLTTSRFAFDIELLVAASRFGYAIAEYPAGVSCECRGGKGRMNMRHIIRAFIHTPAIDYRAGFRRWLEPSLATQLWIIIFVAGVFLFGIGVGKLITPIIAKPQLKQITHLLYLQFPPLTLRGRLLVIGGITLVIFALIRLNKSFLRAFARRDRGDLKGISRK